MDPIKLRVIKPDSRSSNTVVLFIGVIHLIIFSAAYLYKGISVIPFIISIIAVIVVFSASRILPSIKIRKDLLYLLFMLTWVYLDNYLMAMLNILLFIFSYQSSQQVSFIFSEKHIIKDGFFSKVYEWEGFNNVILKDNILTLDFNNNKVLQVETEPLGENEESFNTFVKEILQGTYQTA
ncbi:MAG: hypothetical protein NVSMB45_13100 [Ginsengibacter sp.]